MSETKDEKNPLASDPGVVGTVPDEKLRALLRAWRAPDVPSSLDARVLVAYRRVSAPRFCRRIFTANITVPAPIAAAFGILFLISSLLAVRALHTSRSNQDPVTPSAISAMAGEERPNPQRAAAVGIPATKPGMQTTPHASRASAPAGLPGEDAITSRAILPHPGAAMPESKVSVIFLESDQGTIQLVTGGNYRLNAIPKIYAGNYFRPSDERQKP
jgi:hypothetical protein